MMHRTLVVICLFSILHPHILAAQELTNVPIFVKASGDAAGFSDPSKTRRDAAISLRMALQQYQGLRLVKSEAEALVVLEVLRQEQKLDLSAGGILLGPATRSYLAVRLSVGDYSTDIIGRSRPEVGSSHEESVGDAVKQIASWIKANRIQLEQQWDKRNVNQWTERAQRGEAEAQFLLGVAFAEGRGVSQDDVQMLAWLHSAAEQGHAGADFRLGMLYAAGRAVPKDADRARTLIRSAAERGYAPAQYHVGLALATGAGVGQDSAQAVAWYMKAAEQGHLEAQRELGLALAAGRGVTQDRIEAYKRLHVATVRADGERATAFDNDRRALANQLTPVQLAEGQKRALAWVRAFADR